MSKNSTMTSNISEMLPQQQRNLQHLQSLQNNTRSMSLRSSEYSPVYLQQLQQQQQLQLQQQQQQQQQQPSLSLQSQQQYNIPSQQQQQQGSFQSPLQQQSGFHPEGVPTQEAVNQVSFSHQAQVRTNSNSTFQIPTNIPSQKPTVTEIPIQGKKSLTNSSLQSRPRISLQNQRANQQLDPRSPLVVLMPTNAEPTDALAARFTAWRNIIKSIITYLTETASIQDEIIRQQLRLTHAIQFPFFSVENQYQPSSSDDKTNQSFFLPLGTGSIQDLPTLLNQYHSSLASNASKISKELTGEVIPRLEDLKRDLLVKIKEIKFLHSDFKNNCSKEVQQTKSDMKKFLESVDDARFGTAKQDPYLTKIILDKQIKKQITEENFLHDAFNNLETSGAELEKVVVMEIQNALTIYARELGQQAQIVFDVLISKLDIGFFSKDPQFEWDNFIARDSNFILPNLPTRKMQMIVYKNQYDPLTYEISSGYLEKRSKFLKSYSRGFFVLTPSFLHEFKTPDRKKDLVPVMSLPLNECQVAEHSKKDSSGFKFILHSKQSGIISRGHNWVFKAESYDSMMTWFDNIKILTSFTNIDQKSKFIIERLNLDPTGKPKEAQTKASSIVVSNNDATTNNDDVPSINIIASTPIQATKEKANNTSANTSVPGTADTTAQSVKQTPNIFADIPTATSK